MTTDAAVPRPGQRRSAAASGAGHDHTTIALEVDPLAQRMQGTTVHGTIQFDAPYMSEVADNLWQGGCASGLVLPSFIAHVVSLFNRSGVVAAYALMLDGLSADEAIARVRERRSSAALCNPEFEQWLRQEPPVASGLSGP